MDGRVRPGHDEFWEDSPLLLIPAHAGTQAWLFAGEGGAGKEVWVPACAGMRGFGRTAWRVLAWRRKPYPAGHRIFGMDRADEYRRQAEAAEEQARKAVGPSEREAFERVAQGWWDLVRQAERSARRGV